MDTTQMDPATLKKIDLLLLQQLMVLIEERHVSRAAERLGLGQPAMSSILAKLRDIVGDPILVRGAQGMVPTQRAIEMVAQIEAGVKQIRSAMSEPAQFSPATAARQFRVMAADSVTLTVLPPLLNYFETHAPRMGVAFQPADMRLSRDLLEADQCDLVIALLQAPPEGLHATALYPQRLCVIARQDHPAIAGSISLEEYVSWPHVVRGGIGASPFSGIDAIVDEALKERRLSRTVGTRLSNALIMPAVVGSTNMLGTLAERTAKSFQTIVPLQIMSTPFPVSLPPMLMVWHERTHHDLAHKWLRSAVRAATSTVD